MQIDITTTANLHGAIGLQWSTISKGSDIIFALEHQAKNKNQKQKQKIFRHSALVTFFIQGEIVNKLAKSGIQEFCKSSQKQKINK